MSYDTFAFDPDTAPADADMPAWYEKQAEWSEPHAYNDPAVTTPRLRAFYRELIKVFPPMSGPDCPDDDEEADTDYTIGTNILYVAFRWSKYHHARELFLQQLQTLGKRRGVDHRGREFLRCLPQFQLRGGFFSLFP